jgi:hypothetical protein
MDLRIVIKGLDDKEKLRVLAERRIAAALDRFEGKIRTTTVLLEDVTGPSRHAVDKRCRIEVRFNSGGSVRIDELGEDIGATFSLAVARLKAAIGKQAGRRKRGVGAG